ncbi:MAG: hypothetical protein WA705_12620 [Candidatus Ozemobacteraceae bacterium]
MKSSTGKNFRILLWDSDFFGFKVGRILPSRLTSEELEYTLFELKKENTNLVYWFSDSEDSESQEAARSCHGFLADRKITFLISAEAMHNKLVSWNPKH